MFVELKHIRQPKLNMPSLVPQPADKTVSKKAKSSQKWKKVTSRGDKPKHGRKTREPAPLAAPPYLDRPEEIVIKLTT